MYQKRTIVWLPGDDDLFSKIKESIIINMCIKRMSWALLQMTHSYTTMDVKYTLPQSQPYLHWVNNRLIKLSFNRVLWALDKKGWWKAQKLDKWMEQKRKVLMLEMLEHIHLH